MQWKETRWCRLKLKYSKFNQHSKFQTIQNADWSGKGILACYGHFETDASFDEGAANGGDASVSCAPAEWGGNCPARYIFW